MGKNKADLQSIQKEIKPFPCKEWFQKAYTDPADMAPVCRLIRRKHDKVDIAPRPRDDGKPYLVIKVHGFLSGGEVKIRGSKQGR